MSEVVKIEPRDDATALISVIERAVLNPEIDVEKMERLLAMKDARILASGDRLDMAFPLPIETRELRDWLDTAASLADAVDGV